ncbi:MAG: hypothetical protein OEY70_00955 [Acidimicrobiia bacterium]|nr:hypothetical protein [Acidimicrobiia bacterium]
MMRYVLDAGALIAVERADRRVVRRLARAKVKNIPIVTSSAAVAQVLRDPARQVPLARVLQGVAEAPLDWEAARAIGPLLARAGTADVVDAHVALLAHAGDEILTSDPADLERLTAGRPVRIRPV